MITLTTPTTVSIMPSVVTHGYSSSASSGGNTNSTAGINNAALIRVPELYFYNA